MNTSKPLIYYYDLKLQHIIEQKQALLAREEVSCPALDYSEGMTAEGQKRYINYLAERVRQTELEKRAMKLVMQDFLDQKKADEERLSKLDEVLSRMDSLEESLKDEIRKRKNAEHKVADLTAKLKFANKNHFGSKSQSSKNSDSNNNGNSDRNQDKDDFDGTPSSLPENSIGNDIVEESPKVAPQRKSVTCPNVQRHIIRWECKAQQRNTSQTYVKCPVAY